MVKTMYVTSNGQFDTDKIISAIQKALPNLAYVGGKWYIDGEQVANDQITYKIENVVIEDEHFANADTWDNKNAIDKIRRHLQNTVRKDKIPVPKLKGKTMSEILNSNLPPMVWLWDGLIPLQGFSMLAGAPKSGKSWLALQLGLAVSNGSPLFGKPTHMGRVLYLDLEGNDRRTKTRVDQIKAQVNDRLIIQYTGVKRLDEGLLDQLDGFFEDYPDTVCIIIDHMGIVAPKKKGRREDAYTESLNDTFPIAKWANDNNICVLGLYHTRKPGRYQGSQFDSYVGGGGSFGSAQALLVLANTENTFRALSARGRDYIDGDVELALELSKNGGLQYKGSLEDLRKQLWKEECEQAPFVKLVKKNTQPGGKTWDVLAGEIANELGEDINENNAYSASIALVARSFSPPTTEY